jgi:glyoxylase I family protein
VGVEPTLLKRNSDSCRPSRERGLSTDGLNHVLAVVPVADIDTARDWYEHLLGRTPDNHPMEGLAEWRVTDTGWLQVWEDPDRAGTALLNFAVDDLAAHLDELASRGFSPGEVQTVNKGCS